MRQNKIDILITLDYELFLGQNTGTVYNSIIHPMNDLSNMLNKYNVKTTIFVDAAYLFRLNKLKNKYESLNEDYTLIEEQLMQLSENGHDIQLHMHPQWFYSDFNGEKWKLDFEHYKLSDLGVKAEFYFKECKLLLEQIIRKKVIAFRAGGYSLESYEEYYSLFESNGIKIDSSVLSNVESQSIFQEYNYQNTPNENFYPFKNSLIKVDKNGSVYELPITTLGFNPLVYTYYKFKSKLSHSYTRYGDGSGVGNVLPLISRSRMLMSQLFKKKYVPASIDGFTASLLQQVFSSFKKIPENDKFVIIGHPKNFSPLSIKQLDSFISISENTCNFTTVNSLISDTNYWNEKR